MTREVIVKVIETLKGIDVRGFDSMDKLVGLVMLFTNVLNEIDAMTAQERRKSMQMIGGEENGTE